MASAENIHIPPAPQRESGPLCTDFVQQQIAKQRNNNYHSTSLVNMVATSVNRTALHPGGVQYVFSPFLFLFLSLYSVADLNLGPVTLTLSWRRNFSSTLTSITTELLSYVHTVPFSSVVYAYTN